MSSKHHPFRFSAVGLRGLQPSATLAINEKVNEMWAAGQEVYHLGFGESRFPVHPKIAEALRTHAFQHSYLPSQGLQTLREHIAEFYESRFHIPALPERIIIGPGSKPLIHALLQALDGELILPTPSWVSYQPQAHLVSKPVNWVPASPEDGFTFTVERLRQTIEGSRQTWGNPELLLINSPNNPTGMMLPATLLEGLAQFCREEGMAVISDEIYGLVTHGLRRHHSIARYYPEGTVALGGLSKHLSLGGWRLGVAILPATPAGGQVLRAVRTIASETWSTTTAPVQYAAILAYSGDPDVQAYIDECAYLHAIRSQYLWRQLVEVGIRCPQPHGGFYLFPDFERWRTPLAGRGIHGSDQLALYLLERHQLATLPGSVFGLPPQVLALRLSSSYLDMETAARGQAVLDAHRAGHDAETLMRHHHPQMNQALTRFRRFIAELEEQPAGGSSRPGHDGVQADAEEAEEDTAVAAARRPRDRGFE